MGLAYTGGMRRSLRRWTPLGIGILLVLSPLALLVVLPGDPEPPESMRQFLKLPAVRSGYAVNGLYGEKTIPTQITLVKDAPAFEYTHVQVDAVKAREIQQAMAKEVAVGWKRTTNSKGRVEVFYTDDFVAGFVPIELAIGKGKPRPVGVDFEVRYSCTRRGPGHELRYKVWRVFGIGGP